MPFSEALAGGSATTTSAFGGGRWVHPARLTIKPKANRSRGNLLNLRDWTGCMESPEFELCKLHQCWRKGKKCKQRCGKRQQELAVDMSQRASWDWREGCGKSIPQLEQGSKRPAGFEVGSPKEGQAHRRSGAACILDIGEIRGADAPFAHAGVFGKGKRVSPGLDEIRGGSSGNPARRCPGWRNARPPGG